MIKPGMDNLGQQLAEMYKAACMQELQALKPGNVHIFADGHGMVMQDFVTSAEASAKYIAVAHLSLGQRILCSVQATHSAIGTNTNLGIILLCAPLIQAAFLAHNKLNVESTLAFVAKDSEENTGKHASECTSKIASEHAYEHASAKKRLVIFTIAMYKNYLHHVLNQTTIADANDTFTAIRLMSPSGLGHSERHDVYQSADCDLQMAMQFAAQHDLIAKQYAHYFADIFKSIHIYNMVFQQFNNSAWSTSALYLSLLAEHIDSHIVKKNGLTSALMVKQQANVHLTHFMQLQNPKNYFKTLLDWDTQLKRDGINPGTTADMTVASLFLGQLFASNNFFKNVP